MAAERWLFWHRRDLRLADNLGLAAAAVATPAVTGVFVLDPAILSAADMAPARVWFLLESLKELQVNWRQAGSELLLLQGDPAEVLPQLAEAIGAGVVAWNRDVEPYGRQRDRRVAAAIQAQGQKVLVDWDQLLVAPEALKTGGGDPYRVYGPFKRNWFGQVDRRGGCSRGRQAEVVGQAQITAMPKQPTLLCHQIPSTCLARNQAVTLLPSRYSSPLAIS